MGKIFLVIIGLFYYLSTSEQNYCDNAVQSFFVCVHFNYYILTSKPLRSAYILKERCTQIIIFFKIICFTKRPRGTHSLVHFLPRCSKIDLERTEASKLYPKILLTKYDNKNLSK